MKVRDLRSKLVEMPQDAEVVVAESELQGYMTFDSVFEDKVKLNPESNNPAIKVVVLI